MTTRPPIGLFRRLLFFWRRFWCPHSRSFYILPKEVWWAHRDESKSRLWGVSIECCPDCGETWGEGRGE